MIHSAMSQQLAKGDDLGDLVILGNLDRLAHRGYQVLKLLKAC